MRKKALQSVFPYRIAVSAEGDPGGVMALLDGLREALPRPRYELLPLPGGPELLLSGLAPGTQLDGLVGHFVGAAWRPSGLAVVNLETLSRLRNLPSVEPDWRTGGRVVAEHLSEAGLVHLGFVGARGQFAVQRLLTGFTESCQRAGLTFCQAPALPRDLPEWLRSQAKPLGLLCASPATAAWLARIARESGWGIPEELALVTIGSTTLATLQAGIELSSLPLPDFALGQAAGRSLRAQLDRRSSGPSSFTVAMPPLQVRASSQRRAGRPAALVRLIETLPYELAEELPVAMLAARSGMSRRSFELAFRQATGQSPAKYLQALRIAKAKALLRETRLSVGEVGTRCGYPEPHVFSATFKRIVRKSPLGWRNQS